MMARMLIQCLNFILFNVDGLLNKQKIEVKARS